MNKALIVSSVASMIEQFNMPNIKLLLEEGYEVHVASNFINSGNISQQRTIEFKKELDLLGVFIHQVDFPRSPHSLGKIIKSYLQMRTILKNNFDLVHSHSPVGGIIARIAADKYRKNGLKSIYTAHGFHFSNDSSFLSWLVFFPIEYYASRKTDLLLTINNEDFQNAKKRLKSKKTALINGVGIDLDLFIQTDENSKIKNKRAMNFNEESIISICVGEINKNKNQKFIIDCFEQTLTDSKSHILLIVGSGDSKQRLQEYVNEKKLDKQIYFLGYRKDIKELMSISDIIVSASFREGLPVNIIEGMAMGLTPLVSDCRGNRDLISQNNGFIFNNLKPLSLVNLWNEVLDSKKIREQFMNINKKIIVNYSIETILKEMKEYYNK